MSIKACIGMAVALWLVPMDETAAAQSRETHQEEASTVESTYTPTSKMRRNKRRTTEREAFVNREQVVKGDQSSITFDEVELLGQEKRPSVRDITGAGSAGDYNFLKIRLHWNPEMIQSASHLDGASRGLFVSQ